MPYPKFKSENYTNFGGINRKSSQYITDKNEFLNLENVDCYVAGALSSVPGTTQFNTSGSTPAAASAISALGGFYPQGPSFPGTGNSFAFIAADANAVYNISGGTFSRIYSFVTLPSLPPYYAANFVEGDYLYLSTSGSKLLEYPGFTTAWEYSLPKPYGASVGTNVSTTSGISGAFVYYQAFVRSDGFVGPAVASSIALAGATYFQIITRTLNPYITTAFPSGYGASAGNFGISGLYVWYSLNGSRPALYANTPISMGTSFIFTASNIISDFGTTLSNYQEPSLDTYGTFLFGANNDNGATLTPAGKSVSDGNPAAIEVYANQLFFGGFPSAPDTIWYSDIGDYDRRNIENSFDVVTADGDVVSCLQNYFTQLIIFKTNSIHSLSGSDPSTFQLTQTNSQYGCLSPNGACIWEQNLWFLDKQGICEYNGANTKIVSTRVEDVFKQMNYDVARSTAVMRHVKERSQVWCAIPVGNVSYNNRILIYDYISDAWTVRSGNYIQSLNNIALSARGLTQSSVFYGGASGNIFRYGTSLLSDSGTAITYVIKTRFLNDLGNSVEKTWRRLYLDAVIAPGTTQLFYLNFYANQGTSAVYSTTMALSQFQRRIDFGIQAKDLSVEIIYSGGQYLQLNGFTIEYRFQRAT